MQQFRLRGLAAQADQVEITIRRGSDATGLAGDVVRRRGDYWHTTFQSDAWRELWNEKISHGGNVEPVTANVRQLGRSVAIMPLAIERSMGRHLLTWHAGRLSDYGAPLVNMPNAAAFASLDGRTLLQRIAAEIGGIDIVHLPRQPLRLGSVRNPLVLPDSIPYHVHTHAINFPPGVGWDDFLVSRRSASTRQQLRKKQRKLAQRGQVEFRLANDRNEARRIARLCLDAKSKQLATLGHWDPFASPEVRDFLVDFFGNGPGGATWTAGLYLDDRPLATAIGCATGQEWLLFQMAMDCDDLSQCSPGTQLLANLMRHCIESGVSRLDLSIGDESYKYEWCDEHSRLMNTTLPVSARGQVAHVLMRTRSQLQARVAANPASYAAGKWAKRQIAGLQGRLSNVQLALFPPRRSHRAGS